MHKMLPIFLILYMLSLHHNWNAITHDHKMAVDVNNLRLSDIFIKAWSAVLTVKFCQNLGLLRRRVACRRCRRQMTYDINRLRWLCYSSNHTASDHNGTFFASIHMS